MRRTLAPIIFVIIALVVLSTDRWAAHRALGQAETPLIIVDHPEDWLETTVKVTDLTPEPRGIAAAPAADRCGEATPLELSFAHPADGSGTNTRMFTQEPDDPVLGCMFGAPTAPQGYRTAWYSLTAGDSSIVTITTEGTEYDTVLAVFAGSCGNLAALACSDDFRGFQSSVSFRAIRGRTYLIEVADYRPGAPETPDLRFSAVMHEGGAAWSQVRNLPFGGVSRHAFAAAGPDMYIIGGQAVINDPPGMEITNKFYRYNALDNNFYGLADVPGSSLSNTTAVYLNGKIYVPGGFNGDTSNYANIHLAYDVATNFWDQTLPPIPVEMLPNGKMFAWSAAAAAPDQASYYVTGGATSYHPEVDPHEVVISEVYRYTPATRTWVTMTPMAGSRYGHTAAWVTKANRGLCVAGGLTTGEDVEGQDVLILLTNGECFNPAAGVWQPTGALNFPRYNAGSAVGPDGNWYIFGGLDAIGGVPETEVYNPNTNTWQALSGEYSLGGEPNDPARVWPRGAFWGDTLFVFGGNTPPRENRVISSVDRMTIGLGHVPLANRIMIPLSAMIGTENFLAGSAPLPLNTPISGNFEESTQFINGYAFTWPAFGCATLQLTNVPSRSVLKLHVYNLSKAVLAQDSEPLTGDKSVSVMLQPGLYFATVEREIPGDMPKPNQNYQLSLLTGLSCAPTPLRN